MHFAFFNVGEFVVLFFAFFNVVEYLYMDNKHIINLSKLYWLCGSEIQITGGYPAAKK